MYNLTILSRLQTELGGGGGVLPYKRLMGMCRWMASHLHDWIDYSGVAFSTELLEWGRTFSDFWGWDCSSYLRLANVTECLYFINLKNGSIHKNRKWLSWDRAYLPKSDEDGIYKKKWHFGHVTSLELTHFKKMVRVWKTKSLLFCLRCDPLIVWKTKRRCR